MPIGEQAFSFLKSEATLDDKGCSHVTQKKYLEFMASQGVPKGVLESYNNAQAELVNGMYMLADEQLRQQVKEAKKAGRDPAKEKTSVGVNVPNGSITFSLTAARTYPTPREPGKSVTRTNVGSLDINQKRLFDKGLLADAEAAMAKALGI